MLKTDKKVGYVAIVGRPNVGKSTLLNQMLGFKLAITSRKPQTTRHRILGIAHRDDAQIIFVDTPGLHHKQKGALNRYLNRTASTTLSGVDVVLFVTEGLAWQSEDSYSVKLMQSLEIPIIWVINKSDRCKDKARLLPFIEQHRDAAKFEQICIVSAKHGQQLQQLESTIIELLPATDEFYYSEEQKTDRTPAFIAKEYVREKLMRQLGQELPYRMTVEIEHFKKTDKILDIAAIIWVDKPSHKSIVIGKKGSMLKEIGMKARLDMEKYFQQKVFLRLWTKVRTGWADDERALASLGYVNDV